MSSLKIPRLRIKTIAHAEIIVGGFGDVRQARLRTALFGNDAVVAVKMLRPAGDREQRIRVIAVRVSGIGGCPTDDKPHRH